MSQGFGRVASPATFGIILMLFVSGRLMALLAYPPENLIIYGDFEHYFNVAGLTGQGFWPYLNFWYEFPPIFPFLNIAVYFLAGQSLKNYVVLLALVLLAVDTANLYLLYRLAFALFGKSRAITTAWVYTALFIPAYFIVMNFDALTTFFILLGLFSLVQNRPVLLAAAVGLGTMVKFLPVLLTASVWRLRGLKTAVLYGGATLVIAVVMFAPFAWASPNFTLASLRAQVGKSSYQTVWALLDGNRTTGNFGPLADHFDPATAAEPLNNPPLIPPWLTLIPFGLFGLYVLTRPRQLPDANEDMVIFTAFTFILFFIWSAGWSPQWQTFLIPLLLLALPLNRAVLFIIVLGFVNFLEWPVILSRGLTPLLPVTVILRTLLLLLLEIDLVRMLWTKPA
jgi:hypothetical protein